MEFFGGGGWWYVNPEILGQTSKWKPRITYPVFFFVRNIAEATQGQKYLQR